MLTPLVIALVAVSLLCVMLLRQVHRLAVWREECTCSHHDCQMAVVNGVECQAHQDLDSDTPQVTSVVNVPDQNWVNHAYPLQQVTIKLQGTRHSTPESIIAHLCTVTKRLKAGDATGQEHDDDFGYHFEFVKASPGPSFFDTAASQR